MNTYWKVGPSIGGVSGCLSGFSASPPIHRSTSFKPVDAAGPLMKSIALFVLVSSAVVGTKIALPPEPEPVACIETYPLQFGLATSTSKLEASAAMIRPFTMLQVPEVPVIPLMVTCCPAEYELNALYVILPVPEAALVIKTGIAAETIAIAAARLSAVGVDDAGSIARLGSVPYAATKFTPDSR